VKLFIAVVLAAGLGTVVATIWIGSGVREEQVVEQPYETGLRYDADRAARASLGWTARVDNARLAVGPSVVRFTIWDGAGAPLDGAAVMVAATRPETSRDRVTAVARGLGDGRYEAELPFAAAGRWELALDVRRGADRLVLEREVTVSTSPPSHTPRIMQPSPPAAESSRAPRLRGERGNSLDGAVALSPRALDGAVSPSPRAKDGSATERTGVIPLSPRAQDAVGTTVVGGEGRGEGGASSACDLAAAPCTRALAGGRILTLDLAPRPLEPFTDVAVTADLRDAAGRPLDGADVAVSFAMPAMFMGENRAVLEPASSAGRYAGKAVLVRCPSGRQDWRAEASVRGPGMAPATATFDFRVTE
jgi:nitrogen fixation protein FixH